MTLFLKPLSRAVSTSSTAHPKSFRCCPPPSEVQRGDEGKCRRRFPGHSTHAGPEQLQVGQTQVEGLGMGRVGSTSDNGSASPPSYSRRMSILVFFTYKGNYTHLSNCHLYLPPHPGTVNYGLSRKLNYLVMVLLILLLNVVYCLTQK